ncbi:MAG: glycosyltransferase [Deltaproteobacteria bacterium]|nr:glycosyltransferase [Deltaproteobacteria bacterium]MBW2116692.1 glycosyltransferase [Deltaproteobacteria bacterium]
MKPKISTYIICNGNETDLQTYLAGIREFGDEIIVVNGCLQHNLPGPDKIGEPSFLSIADTPNPAEALTHAVKKANGNWILFLRAGEIDSKQDYQKIFKLCKNNGIQAYQFICQTILKGEELSKYEWLGNFGKFSRTKVTNSGYIPTIEIRLFQKDVFRKVLAVDNDILQLDFDDKTTVSTNSQIRFIPTKTDLKHQQRPDENEKWAKDRQQFFKDDESISDQPIGFELIGPGNIGYSLISEKDLPSLEAGLDMRFGRIEILKWAVHNLIENCSYNKAITFADKILLHFSDSYEIWHLKGIAFFHKLDLANAEKCIHRALEFKPDDETILSDLVRVNIASGNLSEANSILEKVKDLYGLSTENKYIHDCIKQNRGRQAKVSLLIMCRDEEKYIGRALKSVKNIVDEIVAVDTGSKDNTLGILKQNGAKIVHHIWKDDFSEARNTGLFHATGDYVFCMDADEYLEDKAILSFLIFKNLLPLKKISGVVFEIQTLNDSYDMAVKGLPPTKVIRRTALFPNLPGVRFNGKIFETVESSLEALNVPIIFAESISIKHHNNDNAQRRRRKIPAMAKSAADFGPEGLFRGVQFWLNMDDVNQAMEWFERAIVKANGKRRYLNTICQLFDNFKQDRLIQPGAQIFKELMVRYGTSYRIASFCADYLYELKEYDAAYKLFKRLVGTESYQYTDKPQKSDIQRNRLNFAMTCLELDDNKACDKMVSVMSDDIEMVDTARAVVFYSEIRKNELEKAIDILDQWIRERNIPIRDTINNFTEFLQIIIKFSETLLSYGLMDEGKVMIRAAESFALILKGSI